MLRALAWYLRGRDFPALGTMTQNPWPLVGFNWLSPRIRERLYTWSGWSEALSLDQIGQVRAEVISQWVVREYPKRSYPAIMIGSSSGALVHLCAALGIPWLPQTFLIPVRRHGIHPDEPRCDMEWGREPGRVLLDANPELHLHHMHDPNQDRLMIQHMTYFRVKRRVLGEAYTRFILNNLEPGGTLFVAACRLQWPTVQVGERHVFQAGALGGATPEEFYRGSPRVADYLARYHSPHRAWDAPEPDGERPEAEWGFEPALWADVKQLARRRGYRVRHILFDHPEALSPLVADLYRWWYQQRGYHANRLLVESFILHEPWWALRTGCAPFWLAFGVEPSADHLGSYLDSTDPFDDIHMMLFSHGVDGVGVASIDRWRSLLARARRKGDFVGVDTQAFPRDFASFVRYHTAMQHIPARYPIPGPLSLSQLADFLRQTTARYRGVCWSDLLEAS
jgi:hypothetical protein